MASLGRLTAPQGLCSEEAEELSPGLSTGFYPISAKIIVRHLDGRMAFVPEGQHHSSLARSAWNHEENSSVPAGRLNRSQLKSGRTSSDPNFSTNRKTWRF